MHTDQRRTLRLALGVAVAMFVSQAVAWPVSYLAPLVTAAILTMPVVRPPARLFVIIAIALTVSVYSGYLLLPFLLHQKIAGVLLLTIVLYHSFYFTARGGQPVVGLLVTIGLTLAVAIGTVSVDALKVVSAGTAVGAFVGAGVAAFAHMLLPDPAPLTKSQPKPEPQGSDEPGRLAFRALCVVLPVVLWLVVTSSSAAYAAVMIKVAAMGQESTQQGVRDAARSLLVSTFLGGLAAVVLWELLRIWPELLFYVLLFALAAVVFGRQVFSGSTLTANASTWSYALLTLIIVLAPAAVDSQTGADASSRFYDRLIMLGLASVYGVAATGLFDVLFRSRGKSSPSTSESCRPAPGTPLQ